MLSPPRGNMQMSLMAGSACPFFKYQKCRLLIYGGVRGEGGGEGGLQGGREQLGLC